MTEMTPIDATEEWKEIKLPIPAYKSTMRYAVSNHGRLIRFTNDILDGEIIDQATGKGYKILTYRYLKNNVPTYKFLYGHRLVADYFLPGKPKGEVFVLHLDHHKGNNHIDNLKWATQKEMIEHQHTSPAVIAAKKKLRESILSGQSPIVSHNKSRMQKAELNRFYPGEEWKAISLPDKLLFRYAVSSHGRIMSFSDKFENGHILRPTYVEGYTVFRYKVFQNGKIITKHFFVRKLVAQHFLPPPAPEQTFVLLLDRNRKNCRVENLKWATKREMIEHSEKSPYVIKARMNKKRTGKGMKLTSTQVQLIKQKLADPNRKTRLKLIAKQFGVTTMTLQRIKTGENWGHVKIQGFEKGTNGILNNASLGNIADKTKKEF